jgi:hypothetical protein
MLNEIHFHLAAIDDAEFDLGFEHVITRALGSVPRWKERWKEERVNKQLTRLKNHNPGVPVNKYTVNTWSGQIDIGDNDDYESTCSYTEVPPEDPEIERLFKSPDALEDTDSNTLTSAKRRVFDWTDSYVPEYMCNFVSELRLCAEVILSNEVTLKF